MRSAGTRLDPVTAAAGSAHAGGRKEWSAGGGGGGGQRAFANSRPGSLAPARDGRRGVLPEVGARGLERSQPAADVAWSGPGSASCRGGLPSAEPGFCSSPFGPDVTVGPLKTPDAATRATRMRMRRERGFEQPAEAPTQHNRGNLRTHTRTTN